jgi:hypothetical protein
MLWAPFVTERQRPEWSSFCYSEQDWYHESLTIFQTDPAMVHRQREPRSSGEFREFIWEGEDLENVKANNTSGHVSPPPSSSLPINYNVLHETYFKDVLTTFLPTRDIIMSSTQYPREHDLWTWVAPPSQDMLSEVQNDPFATQLTPVFEHLYDVNSTLVGILLTKMIWADFITSLFHGGDHGIVVILHNTCNQSFTYAINNGQVRYSCGAEQCNEVLVLTARRGKAEYLGEGNIHDLSIKNANDSILFNSFLSHETSWTPGHCLYSLSFYRTNEFWDEKTDKNVVFYVLIAFAILAVFSYRTIVLPLRKTRKYCWQRRNRMPSFHLCFRLKFGLDYF